MTDDYAVSATDDGDRRSEHGDLLLRLQGWYKKDIVRVRKWREEAKEAFQFFAGEQWSEEDKNTLREKNRVPVVFNRIAPLVNAVVGSEINNRREVQYIPREIGDAQANEVLTAAGEWFRDQTGAEDEESDAFEDTVVAGMGWTDTRLDFEEDQDGAPKVERIDPMEMVWDCNASKPNLQDAERLFRVKEFPWREACELFPDVPKEMLNATWARSGSDSAAPHDQDRADDYDGTQDDMAGGEAGYQKNCLIVEARWMEREAYYRGPDVQTGEVREYSEKQIKLIRQEMPEFPAVRQTRKVVRRAFIGKDILAEPDRPLVPAGMFGWECITGYRDKAAGLFYGIVRAAMDPQRWTNKFFSQVMFLLNSQSKGGIGAERGAFEDDRQAEASWAKADEITWFAKNALSGPNPKIIPKAPAQFPTGFFTLFQESKEEITQVTGLSPEFIGTREVTQAGVLEMQRRQSSLNLLASLFNSLRRYRKRQGKTMLYLIQNHLSDGRLIRIVGDDKRQYVPLMSKAAFEEFKKKKVAELVQQGVPFDQAKAAVEKETANMRPADGVFDIIVDDAPTSPNEKERTWGILMQLLPMVKEMMTPDVALEMLRYSPLPASMVDKIMKKAQEQQEQAAQQPSPEQQAMAMKQQEMQMDMAGKAADLQIKQQENEMDLQMKGIDLMIKQVEAQNKMALDQAKLENDAARLAMQQQQNAVARQNANSRQTSAAK